MRDISGGGPNLRDISGGGLFNVVGVLVVIVLYVFVGFVVIVVGKGWGLDPLVGVGVVWCAS